jgi:hypothetical protein
MKGLGPFLQWFPPHTLGNPGTTVMAQTNLANIFTLAQFISSANAGTLLSLETSNSDATGGANIDLYVNSATPAASDELSQINFFGKDSGANKTLFGALDCILLDPTNTSEDGFMRLLAMVAGTVVASLSAGDGVLIGSSTGSFPGANKINANAYKVAGVELANGTLQRTYDEIVGPQASVTGQIDVDDSPPLITEGEQLFSRAITPKSATSRIRITGNLNWAHESGAGNEVVFALFNGSTLIRVWRGEMISNASMVTALEYEEVSGSTTVRTYSLRWGAATAALHTLNNGGDGNDLGDKIGSTFCIEEYLP